MAEAIEAAKGGDLSTLRRLYQTGSLSVDFRFPPEGTTVLYWAACCGHLRTCDWLLRHSADVNLPTEKSGSTALHAASDRGHTDCVRHLLRRGGDVTCRTTSNGDTPLHLAAYRGHYDICRLLLESGACAEALNKQGRTSIQEAQTKHHSDVIRLLVKFRPEDGARGFDRSRTLEIQRPLPLEVDERMCLSSQPDSNFLTVERANSPSISSKKCMQHMEEHRPDKRHKHLHTCYSDSDSSSSALFPKVSTTQHLSRSQDIPDSHQHRISNLDDEVETSQTADQQSELDGAAARRDELTLRLRESRTLLTNYFEGLQGELAQREHRIEELTRQNEDLVGELRCREHTLRELEKQKRANLELRDQWVRAAEEIKRLRLTQAKVNDLSGD